MQRRPRARPMHEVGTENFSGSRVVVSAQVVPNTRGLLLSFIHCASSGYQNHATVILILHACKRLGEILIKILEMREKKGVEYSYYSIQASSILVEPMICNKYKLW